MVTCTVGDVTALLLLQHFCWQFDKGQCLLMIPCLWFCVHPYVCCINHNIDDLLQTWPWPSAQTSNHQRLYKIKHPKFTMFSKQCNLGQTNNLTETYLENKCCVWSSPEQIHATLPCIHVTFTTFASFFNHTIHTNKLSHSKGLTHWCFLHLVVLCQKTTQHCYLSTSSVMQYSVLNVSGPYTTICSVVCGGSL